MHDVIELTQALCAIPSITGDEADKVALLFSVDDKNARLHPRETLVTGPDFVIANFFVQSYS